MLFSSVTNKELHFYLEKTQRLFIATSDLLRFFLIMFLIIYVLVFMYHLCTIVGLRNVLLHFPQ